MPKLRKVIKTGNSLAITIPSQTIKNFNIKEGDLAAVRVNSQRATISFHFSGHPRQLYLLKNRSSSSHAKTKTN